MNEFMPDLLTIAYNAGKAILEIYNKEFDVVYKEDRSPLTLADKESHKIISDSLSAPNLEQFPIFSEEGNDISYEERKKWEFFWLVDPLDGTKEFIKRNGEFTVNIALIHKGRPILGVIYIPVKDIFYFAAEGLGAWKLQNNGIIEGLNQRCKDKEELLKEILNYSTNLRVNNRRDDSSKYINIIGSVSHATKEQERFVEELKKRFDRVEFLSAGSSLKFGMVAEAAADVYPRFGPTREWDTAAGQAIVEQAGGKVLEVFTMTTMKYNKENILNPWFIVINGNDSYMQDITECIQLTLGTDNINLNLES